VRSKDKEYIEREMRKIVAAFVTSMCALSPTSICYIVVTHPTVSRPAQLISQLSRFLTPASLSTHWQPTGFG
jgi:hypothetical protein